MEKIKNFNDLMKNVVGTDKSIVDTKVTNLTLPGENYMSDIIKIRVILKNNNNGVTEDLHLVAKLAINTNFMGSTANLTRNEILFYKEMVPAMESFQKNHGIEISDFFPKYIAGRINLNGSDIPDLDSVIVLEDLSELGYKNIDRHIGFDLDGAKLILKDLAIFHAVPLAMRLLQPETYKTKILKNCSNFIPDLSKENHNEEAGEKQSPDLFIFLMKLLQSDEKYSTIIPTVQTFFKNLRDELEKNPEEFFTYKPDTQFETLTHEDMWSNNTMQISQDGKLIKNKFVDFQMVRSNTLFNDLIFFLVTSVQLEYLQENFDQLIQWYYENFSDSLKLFGCFSKEYTFDKFLEALPKECQKGIIQCTYMIVKVIFNQKGKAVDERFAIQFEDVPLIAKEKVGLLFQEAVKRGWLSQ